MALKFLNDGYFAGSVGIGTESPLKKLSINGGDVAVNNGNSFIVGAAITGNTQIGELGADSGQLQLLTESTRDIKFGSTTYGNIMFLGGSNGNVGIGTTAPGRKLEVDFTSSVYGAKFTRSDATGSSLVEFANSAGVKSIIGYDAGVDGYKIGTASATNLVVKQNGNVGIGTTSPSARLQVEKSSEGSIPALGANTSFLKISNSTGNYGSMIGQLGSGNAYFQVQRFDGSATAYNLLLQPNGGNVGIGTTSPSDLLMVAGNARVTGTLKIADGTYNAPSIAHRADEDTGIYFPTNDTIGISTAALERMRITSAGNVGIGTTAPGTKLEIETADATTYSTSALSQNILRLQNTSATTSSFAAISFAVNNANSTTGNAAISAFSTSVNSSAGLSFQTRNSGAYLEAMRINPDGNVGIGATTPATKLHVNGAIGAYTSDWVATVSGSRLLMKTFAGTGDTYSLIQAQDFGGNSNNALALQPYGDKVGIGTTSPATTLHVNGFARLNGGLQLNTADAQIYQIQNSNLRFGTNNTERMRINGSGNVGIGTTSPDTKLDINDADPFITIQGSNSSYTNAGVQFISNNASTLRGLGNFYYSAHSDVEWFSGNPYNNNDAFVINRNANYTVPSSQSSPPGIGASAGTLFKINSAGALQFNSYSSTNQTGTPTYLLGTDASGNVVKTNTVPGSGAGPYLPLAGGTMTGTSGVLFPDNFKLNIGTGSDLQMYHDGSNSYISDTGTGRLILSGGSDIQLQSPAGELMADFNGNGSVDLYYDNSKKFETTSTGVTVTGDVTASGTVNADTYFQSTDASAVLATNGAGSVFLRPNGPGSGTGALSVASSGNVVALGTVTAPTFTTSAATGWLVKNSGGNHGISYDGTDTVIQNNGVYSIRANGTSVYLRNTYITGLLDVTAGGTFAGTVTSPTFLGDLNGTINTVTTAVTKANATNDTTVATTAFVQNLIGTIPAGLVFQGTWNAATNTPTLTSGTGTTGNFYIVSVDGSTNLDGITDWKVGDWAVFVEQGASDQWEKVDNSSVLDGSGTGQTLPLWSGSGTSNTLDDSILTQSGGSIITQTATSVAQYSLDSIAANDSVVNFKQAGVQRAKIGYDNSEGALAFVQGGGAFSTAGMVLDATGVGIGTTSPGVKLDVNSSGSDSVARFTSTDARARILISDNNDTSYFGTYLGTTFLGGDDTPSGNTINVLSNGNVGIGTASPAYKLDVNGNVSATVYNAGAVVLSTRASKADLYGYSGPTLSYYNGTAIVPALTVDYGKVGIGTPSPSYTLDVAGAGRFSGNLYNTSGDANGIKTRFISGAASGSTTDGTLYLQYGKTNGVSIGEASTGGLTVAGSVQAASYKISGATVLQGYTTVTVGSAGATGAVQLSTTSGVGLILNGGNVGIGTTSPSYKLDVIGGIKGGGKITYTKSAGSLDTTGYDVAGLTTSSNGQSACFTFTCFGHAGGYQKIVYSCYNSGGVWIPKKVINEGTNQLDVVASANGTTITFTFKSISGTMSYTPRVTVEAMGTAINSTYA